MVLMAHQCRGEEYGRNRNGNWNLKGEPKAHISNHNRKQIK